MLFRLPGSMDNLEIAEKLSQGINGRIVALGASLVYRPGNQKLRDESGPQEGDVKIGTRVNIQDFRISSPDKLILSSAKKFSDEVR